METPALYRLEDCRFKHNDGYLQTEKPRPIRPGAIRIRRSMLTAALLGAIQHSDNEERRTLVLADDSLAGEPRYDGLGEVQGIHLVATTGRERTEYRLCRDAQGNPRIAVAEGCDVIRADTLEYRLHIRAADGGIRQAWFATSHHFALSNQRVSTDRDNVVLALAPDDDMHPDDMASRAAETCYRPGEDFCDQCGALSPGHRMSS